MYVQYMYMYVMDDVSTHCTLDGGFKCSYTLYLWHTFSETGPAPLPGQMVGRSFDPAELGDSSDEDDEDVFIAPAPPDYQDVIG